MSKTTDAAQELLKPVVERMGFELVDVEFKKEHNGFVLTLYIDSERGVTIDDCEAVSRAVDPVLDEHDIIGPSYYLSVSSPGLDRPLKKEKDFLRHLGEKIMVKLYPQKGRKQDYVGTIAGFSDGVLELEIDGVIERFDAKDISTAKLLIEF